MDTPDTPSLSILKSDAEALLRDARDGCPDAVIRLVRQGFRRAEELTIHACASLSRSMVRSSLRQSTKRG